MSKIIVFIENNMKELRFDTCILKPAGSVMTLKNASVYWDYKDVIAGENDHVMRGTTRITFEEGYWTFDMIEEKLGEQSVQLVANERGISTEHFVYGGKGTPKTITSIARYR